MGGNNYDEAVGVVAHNKVHYSAAYPSQIRVSVVKRCAVAANWNSGTRSEFKRIR